MKAAYTAISIIGIFILVSGTIFALQGVGLIPGSFMTNNSFWIYAGSAIAVVGLVIAFVGFRMGSRKAVITGSQEGTASSQKDKEEKRS